LDNLCHTLTGAALAEAGLGSRTRFGAAALMIAANLPDIDVLAFASDTPAVAIRRGITHGVVAQVVLPVALTAAFVLLDRWRPPRSPDASRVRPSVLLLLCYLAGLSHVGMDWLNNYGVRLLMPFSDRWFYGDAVFIVDPWLWLTLGAGCLLARRRRRASVARVALAVATVYIVAMIASASSSRHRVREAWTRENATAPSALMVGPVPIDPFRKSVIVDAGEYYQRGAFRWFGGGASFDAERIPKRRDHPAAQYAARMDPDFRAVLRWARFPLFEIAPVPGGTRVTLSDMRFNDRNLFAVSTIVPDH
jgi:inner membrane protein